MRIVLISTPIGFLGSGKGGGVELTLNSLVSGLLSLGHSVEVIAPKNSKLPIIEVISESIKPMPIIVSKKDVSLSLWKVL